MTSNEILVVDIVCRDFGKIAIILCYRPPSDHSMDFINHLRLTLDNCVNAGLTQLCMIGDINFPNIDWNLVSPKNNSAIDIEMCNLLQEFNLS